MVVLDENGNIVDFESTLEDIPPYNKEDFIGKNWFETFINPADKEKIFTVFKEILKGNLKDFETFENDVYCIDGSHRLIDFYNKLIQKKGKRYTFSVGIEHRYYKKELLKELAEKLYDKSRLSKI